jgi:uncharacterized protein YbjT (DUF2867 family)
MRIVINTPTGTIGHRLTELLLDAGASLTLITRDVTKVADSAARGARVVEGSIDAPAVLAAAFDGADQLFWLTPPSYRPDAGAWAVETARVAAAAARSHGLTRVVVLSSTGAHSGPGTGAVGHLLAVEDAFRDAVPDVVVLRPGFLMENLLRDVPSILSDGAIYSPNPGGKAVPMVAAADVAARAAAFLLDGGWSGHRIVGVHGPADLGYAQVAAISSHALDRPVRHVETTLEQTRAACSRRGSPTTWWRRTSRCSRRSATVAWTRRSRAATRRSAPPRCTISPFVCYGRPCARRAGCPRPSMPRSRCGPTRS